MKPRILGIDHIVLRVEDVPGMVRFYCQVLGCREERMRPEIGLYQLRAGAALIDLVDVAGEIGRQGGAAAGAEGHNMDHLCLRVEPFDATALRDHLRAHGVAVGKVVSRYGAEGEGPSLYLQDPEGNRLETWSGGFCPPLSWLWAWSWPGRAPWP